ncbi:MAG: sulfatase-like hydrolase/transferase [Proteobacteria bacterium]|nr:sulfatase-like hydrolase/transferase [Pseudomonadota bacterium]MDA1323408.1 sulfatase-like hydrolase/transferase [Pseudomonadota bacterium]
MRRTNILIIMADEHNRAMLGCAGNKLVKTPNLDGLAARGTRFTNAYTNNPICVPSRAAFQTGNYTHRVRYWDNSIAYDGRIEGWGHQLQAAGYRVESIGKLHYRREEDPLGFDRKHIPMYIKEGVGSVTAAIRDPLPDLDPEAEDKPGFAAKACVGESSYTQYDRRVCELSCDWLAERGANGVDRPWALFASFLSPHYPLTVPQEFFGMYAADDMPYPKLDPNAGYKRHPWVDVLARRQPHANCLTPEKSRIAYAAYLGLCSFVDAQIGRVLAALDAAGMTENTRILYASDHGENAGARGLWGKSVLYEESTGIPLIMAGPDIAVGAACRTPVSLVDMRPTIVAAAGLDPRDQPADLPGRSLFDIVAAPADPDRIAFSEYHASASPSGGFMLRKGRYKFNYYVGYRPELFDLVDDPEETNDLAQDPAFATVCRDYEALLRTIVDPEAADRQAKDDQNAVVELHGGRAKVLRDKLGAASFTPVPGAVAKSF